MTLHEVQIKLSQFGADGNRSRAVHSVLEIRGKIRKNLFDHPRIREDRQARYRDRGQGLYLLTAERVPERTTVLDTSATPRTQCLNASMSVRTYWYGGAGLDS
jgi:hypothetical protein